MATWRQVVYDTWSSLKQAFDDGDISISHVQYWVSVHASQLLSQHIDKRDSGAYLTEFHNIQVSTDPITGYKYIDLPADIFDYDKDGGIEFISYGVCVDDCTPPFTSVMFSRITPSASRLLYFTEEERPTPANPYFYRVDDRIYFLGLECINACGIDMAIYMTVDPMTCDLDDDFPLPDELIPVLIRRVLDIGRFVMSMPSDRINEGDTTVGGSQNIPTSKLISVNSMNQPSAAEQQAMIAAQQQQQQ
jgi:hypothetical protein